MTFALEPGELANVLQFLASGRRSGRLTVHVAQIDRHADLYFRNGRLYYAKYRRWEGTEAIARLVAKNDLQAEFIDGETEKETNIDLQNVETLLVRCIVRADELAEIGEDDEEGSHEGKDHSRFELRRRNFVLRRAQGPLRAVVKVVAVITVFSSCYYLTTWGYNIYQNQSIRRMKQETREEYAQRMRDISRRRRSHVDRLFRTGVRAYSTKNYDQALHCAQQILNMQPNHEKADVLKTRTERALALIAAAPIKGRAQAKLAEIEMAKAHPSLGKTKDNAVAAFEAAETLFEAGEYERAAEGYVKAVQSAQTYLEQIALQQAAAEQQVAARNAQRLAAESLAPQNARPLWRSAEGLDVAAADAFAAGRFKEAFSSWKAAAEHYQQAANAADDRRVMSSAKNAYQELLQTAQMSLLDRFGGASWKQAADLAEDAKEAGESKAFEKAAELWQQARLQLATAVETAYQQKNAADFKSLLERAEDLSARKQWADAISVYVAALEVSGYDRDATALGGLHEARKGAALVRASEARRRDDWEGVLAAAKEVLVLDPESAPAADLQKLATETLVPRLTIRAALKGKLIEDAVVVLDHDVASSKHSPATFELELNQSYNIRVELPPDGNTFYRPFETAYVVKHKGQQTFTAPLSVVAPPAPGENWTVPMLDLELAAVPAGRIRMGTENGRADERPVHAVQLSSPFWMAAVEVSNGQYRQFLEASGYSGAGDTASYLQHFSGRSKMSDLDSYPVCYVRWTDAVAFCKWLTARERSGGRLPPGYVYRLPTEAEWEYCARAGGGHETGTSLDSVAWYAKTSNQQTQPVGSKLKNPWGLGDMLGNVWEWCYDWYGPYPAHQQVDPIGAENGTFRVIRGGSWRNANALCSATYRNSAPGAEARPDLGFRVVLAPPLSAQHPGEARAANLLDRQ